MTSLAIVLPRFTGYSSSSDIPTEEWPHIRGLEAYPDLTSADPIDILISADVYPSIILTVEHHAQGLPTATYSTENHLWIEFVWIPYGNGRNIRHFDSSVHRRSATLHSGNSGSKRSFLSPQCRSLKEDQDCEELFANTHTPTVVRLPMTVTLPDFSETRAAAIHSLLRTERRFLKNH